jgi:tight adherence protein B
MSTRSEAAAAYSTPAGAATIGFGAVATVVGYRLMLRAARLPEERRLG